MASQNEASIRVLLSTHDSRETLRVAGTVLRANSALQIFRSVPASPLLPQELSVGDPLDVMLQPFVPVKSGMASIDRLPESLLFLARSTRYLPRCCPKRCAPNRGEWLLEPANVENCDALTALSNPTPTFHFLRITLIVTENPLPQ